MLRHGAEINTVDKSGCSALMVAADKGHSGTVGESLTCSEELVFGQSQEVTVFVSSSHPPSPGQGRPDTAG